jgi:hypothetical protein
MKLSTTVLLLILGFSAASATAKKRPERPVSDGKAVLRECSLTLDLNVYHPRKVKTKFEAFDLGYCLGLVEGVYDNTSGQDFCPPDGVKTEHVLEVTVGFIRAHPELQEKVGADIVRWALSEVYPCPTKNHSSVGEEDVQAVVRH